MLVYRCYAFFAGRSSALEWLRTHPDVKFGAHHYVGFYKERGSSVHCLGPGPRGGILYEYTGEYDAIELVSVERNIEFLVVEEVYPPKPLIRSPALKDSERPGWKFNYEVMRWESVGPIEKESVQLVDLVCWRQRSTGFLVWALADYVGFATQVGDNRFRVF